MSIRDVQVTITRETRGVTQRGFGLPLILSTEKVQGYTRYRQLADLSEDFQSTTDTYKLAQSIFRQSPRPEEIVVLGVDSSVPGDLTDALDTAVAAGNDDWYFLLCNDHAPEVQDALAGWITNGLYFTSTDDVDYPATLENDRVVVLVHDEPEQYPEGAWVGKCAPQLPGSITWKFKILNGITSSGLTATEQSTVNDGNGNYVARQGGILHTFEGKATSGEFIDIMRTMDFIEARIKENVFVRLVNAGKIPFTNSGISTVVEGVEEALLTAYNQGAIADGNPSELTGTDPDPGDEDLTVPLYEITAPRREEVPLNDRANRILPDVNFVAILAGAVHEVRVVGVLQV